MIKRFANTLIFQGVFPFHVGAWQFLAVLVKSQKDGAVFHPVHYFQVGVGAQARQVLRAGVQHQVHFARQNGRYTGSLGLDGRVNDFGHIAFHLAPPVGVFRKNHFLVWYPLLEREWARTHSIAVCKSFLGCVFQILGLYRVVFFCPRLAHHSQLCHLSEHDRVGPVSHDVDRMRVHFHNAIKTDHVRGEIGGFAHGSAQ